MADIRDIANAVGNPNQVESKIVDSLSNLADQYPYSQVFSVLYLKGLSLSKDLKFDKELQKHSYRITDRYQLYNLIENYNSDTSEVVVPEIKPEENKVETAPSEDILEESKIELIEDAVTPENIEKTIEGVTDIQSKFKEELPPSKADESRDLIETHEGEENDIPEEVDALDKSILSHAASVGYQINNESGSNDIIEPIEIDLKTDKENKIESAPEGLNEEILKASEQSFLSWLKSNSSFEESENEDKLRIQAVVNDFEEFDPSEDLFGESDKPKTEFFSPIEKAKESLDEDSIPVSETLANIYELQGNYPKAITAYEQLILKNPEKKSLFAIRIKELKKKLQSK